MNIIGFGFKLLLRPFIIIIVVVGGVIATVFELGPRE